MGTSFTQLRLFFHKAFIIDTFSTYVWDDVCQSYKPFCWRVEVFHARCVSARRLSQNGVLGVHPSGDQEDWSCRVLNRDCRENEGENSTPVLPNTLLRRLVWGRALSCRRRTPSFPFGRTLRIRCFNFLNIWTYRSELVVVPLSKNSTYKIPSLFQNTLAMTLPVEVSTLNFFRAWQRKRMPFHVFPSVGRKDEPRFHHG
jgi:hypothetical protein